MRRPRRVLGRGDGRAQAGAAAADDHEIGLDRVHTSSVTS
jgi:hypothetical protein